MNMQTITIVLLFYSFFVAQADANSKDGTTASLFRDIESMLKDEQDGIVDFENFDDATNKVLQIFDEYEIDSSFLFENDANIFKVIWSTVFGGETKTSYTPYMLSFQLICYQGLTKGPIDTATYVHSRYNDYGCHCGGGRSGGDPVDDTDKCCKTHDRCYETVMQKFNLNQGCDTYKTAYKATCCKKEKRTICIDSGPSAERELCQCDQDMGKCVAVSSYRSTNKHIRKNKKKCKGSEKASSFFSVIASCTKVRRRRSAKQNRAHSRRRYGAGKPACVAKKRSKRNWW